MLNIIVDLWVNLISSFGLIFAAREIDGKKKKIGIKFWCATVVLGILAYYFSNYMYPYSKIIFTNISLLIVVKFFLHISFFRAAIVSMITYACIAFSDILSGAVLFSFFRINLEVMSSSILGKLSVYTLTILVLLPLSKLIFFKKIVNICDEKLRNYKEIIILFWISVIIILAISVGIFKIIPKDYALIYGSLLILIYILIIIIYCYLNLRLVKEKELYLNKEREYENLMLYTNIIEELLDDRKKFMHDFENIMLSFKEFIDNKDIDSLEKYYYNEILSEKKRISNKNIYLLKHIKNSSLKGLLTAKFDRCLNLRLNISIEIFDDIDELNIETVDICRIVGVLLDNAIEAAISSKEKKISFGILKEEKYISIIISNSISMKPNSNKIFEKGYSEKGNNRGLGLNIVKEIIDRKYKNILLNTTTEEDIFIQEIIICQSN